MKKEMYGWLNASLKSTETRYELSTTCNPKVMSRFLSVPVAISLHHCLKNKHYTTVVSVVGSKYLVLLVEEGVGNTCI